MQIARKIIARGTAAAGVVAMAASARGVVVFNGDGRNLAPPTGSLLTPWNLQGHIVGDHINYNGTPIDPSHLISAAHTSAGVNSQVIFGNSTYDIIGQADIPGSDLRVMTIDTHGGTTVFPTYAPLWNASVDGSEVGHPLAVFGRGMARGAAILAPIPSSPLLTPGSTHLPTVLTAGGSSVSPTVPQQPGDLRGWGRGVDDRQQSWGENIVDEIVPIAGPGYDYGDTIAYSFTNGPGAVANEANLSGGDSGGGLFILSNGVWKLAGVNFSVDGNWSYGASGPYFGADIFDARGLYVGTADDHQLVPYDTSPIAGSSYSTRIASHLAAISAVTGVSYASGPGPILVPEPGVIFSALGAMTLVLRSQRRTR